MRFASAAKFVSNLCPISPYSILRRPMGKKLEIWLRDALQDLHYAFRTFRRDVGFATFAVLIVGLGVGASSTVFSVLNTLLIRPLPFQAPDRLVWVVNHEDASDMSGRTTQVDHFLDLRGQSRSFSDLAAYFAFYGVGDNKLTRDRKSVV